MEKKSNKFHQGALTIVIFLVIFTGRAKNLKKLDQLCQVSIHDHLCNPSRQTALNSFGAEI